MVDPDRVRVLPPRRWAGRLDRDDDKEERHSPEQVVRKLAHADRLLGERKGVADVCRELQVSEQKYYRWRNQFGGLKAEDAKRLKELERENQQLKKAVSELTLDKLILREALEGKY